jgi:hypothetical protein
VTWVVFAAYRAGDPALENSRWIARQTARLGGVGEEQFLEGPAANRAPLELALLEATGVALHAHGNEREVLGSDGTAALDHANAVLAKQRWIYAASCRVGSELANRWASAGASAVVAYEIPLTYDWAPERMEPELREAFGQVLACPALYLAQGGRSERAMRISMASAARKFRRLRARLGNKKPGKIDITLHQHVHRMLCLNMEFK